MKSKNYESYGLSKKWCVGMEGEGNALVKVKCLNWFLEDSLYCNLQLWRSGYSKLKKNNIVQNEKFRVGGDLRKK